MSFISDVILPLTISDNFCLKNDHIGFCLATLHYLSHMQGVLNLHSTMFFKLSDISLALDGFCTCSSGWSCSLLLFDCFVKYIQGLMFNVGLFMGWSDLNPAGEVNWATLIPVYVGCVCWTISYETIYQHQAS